MIRDTVSLFPTEHNPAHSDARSIHWLRPKHKGAAVVRTYKGSTRNDVFTAQSLEQSDFRDIGAGRDTVTGGSQNDNFYMAVDGLVDTVNGSAGDDLIDFSASAYQLSIDLSTGNVRADFGSTNLLLQLLKPVAVVSGIENVTGSRFNDLIIGSSDANRLDGGAGNDVIRGGGGNDILIGGTGDDVLDGGTGNDTVDYSSSQRSVFVDLNEDGGEYYVDQLYHVPVLMSHDTYASVENIKGSAHDDILFGDANANVIDGGDGWDYLRGGDGDDTLIGGTGTNTLDGGVGNDTVDYSTSDVFIFASLYTGGGTVRNEVFSTTLHDSFKSIENLTGSGYGDWLFGDDSANVIDGGRGDDRISGGGGDDTLIGNFGNNALDGGAGIDTANYSKSSWAIWASLEIRFGGTNEDVWYWHDTYTSIENLTGSSYSDFLQGDYYANVIDGGDGDDRIDAGSGNDTLIGGTGDNTLVGGSGIDTANYATSKHAVSASLYRSAGSSLDQNGITHSHDSFTSIENLVGSSLNDFLEGDANANVINGGDGNDEIRGGGGNDTLSGGGGDDVIYVGSGSSVIDGGSGTDWVSFGLSAIGVTIDLANGFGHQSGTAAGSDGNTYTGIEKVEGSNYNDYIFGDSGNNVINGLAGDDFIEGGSGADTLDGGSGINTLSYLHSWSRLRVDLATGITLENSAPSDRFAHFQNVIGSGHGDILIGSNGDNVLFEHLGVDQLAHSIRDGNQLTGGGGRDTFAFMFDSLSAHASPNSITDFHIGEDKLAFGGNVSMQQLHFSQLGTDTIVTIDNAADSVILQNVNMIDLMQHASQAIVFSPDINSLLH